MIPIFEILDEPSNEPFCYSVVVGQYATHEEFVVMWDWCNSIFESHYKVGTWKWQFESAEDRTYFLLKWS
jgi:hypothetical protein